MPHSHAHTVSRVFQSWFHHTEPDGTPLLPSDLVRAYEVQDKVLGHGSFAVVKLVRHRATGEERALKIVAKKPLKSSDQMLLQDEMAILQRVHHPHVIQLYDLYETREGVFMVTDYCRGGELFDSIVAKVHYDELDARHMVRQLFEGIAYLHSIGIVHRDIKPENILLKTHDDPPDLVISDFGLSKMLPHDVILTTACGSPQYVSPEVLMGERGGYGFETDVWSAGVVTYCILGGYTPFYGDSQTALFKAIMSMHVEFEEEYWRGITDTAKDFIRHCLTPASKRMTARQALAHPWLADLPPHHTAKDTDRGVSLAPAAERHAITKKLRSAVTVMEVVGYLKTLSAYRQEQETEKGAASRPIHRSSTSSTDRTRSIDMTGTGTGPTHSRTNSRTSPRHSIDHHIEGILRTMHNLGVRSDDSSSSGPLPAASESTRGITGDPR